MNTTNTFSEHATFPEKKSTSKFLAQCAAFSLSLYVVDTLVYIFLCELSFPMAIFFGEEVTLNFQSVGIMLKLALSISVIKLVFFTPLQLMPFIWLVRKVGEKRKMLGIALLNSGLFVLIILFYVLVLYPDPRLGHLINPFFYFQVIAAFLSPFILGRVSFFQKLSQEL